MAFKRGYFSGIETVKMRITLKGPPSTDGLKWALVIYETSNYTAEKPIENCRVFLLSEPVETRTRDE